MALTDINAKSLETTVAKLKADYPDVEVKAIEMDVGIEEQVEKSIADTVSAFGRIDFAVNNAGIGGLLVPTPELPTSEWMKVQNINVNVC